MRVLIEPGHGSTGEAGDPVLRVEDLVVRYEPRLGAPVTAVDGVSFTLGQGEFVGLIGESGCGKSTLGTAVLRLLQRPARVTGGRVLLGEDDLLGLDDEALRRRRWSEVATVFQSSMNSLNPVTRVSATFADVMRAHTDLKTAAIRTRSEELLEMVQIDPGALSSYPHELSGGMKQRVNLALALALRPRFVLLDEPTTGLDVIVQRRILDNIRQVQREQQFTVLFISHDMGAVLETSDRILVMYAGRIVESGRSAELMHEPLHPYTKALLGSYGDPRADEVAITYLPGRPFPLSAQRTGCAFADRCPEVTPTCREIDPPLEPIAGGEVACLVAAGQHGAGPLAGEAGERIEGFAGPAFHKKVAESTAREGETVIELADVVRTFSRRQGLRTTTHTAVDHVSFALLDGRVTALVGESGSGKSTLAKLVTGITAPTSGSVRFHPRQGSAVEVSGLRGAALRDFRAQVQYVFQDPYAALNPAHTVGHALVRAVRNFTGLRGQPARERAAELLETVGLHPGVGYLGRFPYQLSGGQRQRVVIARALASRPRLLVADEPIASLDVSIRAEILELLDRLVADRGVGILYITHDLLSARMLADEVLVLNEGVVVESGPMAAVINAPQHDYTRALLAAVPNPAG